jgi:hypothetical protein
MRRCRTVDATTSRIHRPQSAFGTTKSASDVSVAIFFALDNGNMTLSHDGIKE